MMHGLGWMNVSQVHVCIIVYEHFFLFGQIDWSAQMRADWDFSEDGAYDALQLFLSDGRYQSRDDKILTNL